MPAVDKPTINGIAYDYASIEVQVDGVQYIQVQDVAYNDSCEPGEGYGTHPQAVVVTTGQYKAEGSMSLYLEAAELLRTALGAGFMVKTFDVVINFAPTGKNMVTHKLLGCRIKRVDDSHAQGTDAIKEKFDLRVTKIERGGILPLPDMF